MDYFLIAYGALLLALSFFFGKYGSLWIDRLYLKNHSILSFPDAVGSRARYRVKLLTLLFFLTGIRLFFVSQGIILVLSLALFLFFIPRSSMINAEIPPDRIPNIPMKNNVFVPIHKPRHAISLISPPPSAPRDNIATDFEQYCIFYDMIIPLAAGGVLCFASSKTFSCRSAMV